jgi:hypothetical protein
MYESGPDDCSLKAGHLSGSAPGAAPSLWR